MEEGERRDETKRGEKGMEEVGGKEEMKVEG